MATTNRIADPNVALTRAVRNNRRILSRRVAALLNSVGESEDMSEVQGTIRELEDAYLEAARREAGIAFDELSSQGLLKHVVFDSRELGVSFVLARFEVTDDGTTIASSKDSDSALSRRLVLVEKTFAGRGDGIGHQELCPTDELLGIREAGDGSSALRSRDYDLVVDPSVEDFAKLLHRLRDAPRPLSLCFALGPQRDEARKSMLRAEERAARKEAARRSEEQRRKELGQLQFHGKNSSLNSSHGSSSSLNAVASEHRVEQPRIDPNVIVLDSEETPPRLDASELQVDQVDDERTLREDAMIAEETVLMAQAAMYRRQEEARLDGRRSSPQQQEQRKSSRRSSTSSEDQRRAAEMIAEEEERSLRAHAAAQMRQEQLRLRQLQEERDRRRYAEEEAEEIKRKAEAEAARTVAQAEERQRQAEIAAKIVCEEAERKALELKSKEEALEELRRSAEKDEAERRAKREKELADLRDVERELTRREETLLETRRLEEERAAAQARLEEARLSRERVQEKLREEEAARKAAAATALAQEQASSRATTNEGKLQIEHLEEDTVMTSGPTSWSPAAGYQEATPPLRYMEESSSSIRSLETSLEDLRTRVSRLENQPDHSLRDALHEVSTRLDSRRLLDDKERSLVLEREIRTLLLDARRQVDELEAREDEEIASRSGDGALFFGATSVAERDVVLSRTAPPFVTIADEPSPSLSTIHTQTGQIAVDQPSPRTPRSLSETVWTQTDFEDGDMTLVQLARRYQFSTVSGSSYDEIDEVVKPERQQAAAPAQSSGSLLRAAYDVSTRYKTPAKDTTHTLSNIVHTSSSTSTTTRTANELSRTQARHSQVRREDRSTAPKDVSPSSKGLYPRVETPFDDAESPNSYVRRQQPTTASLSTQASVSAVPRVRTARSGSTPPKAPPPNRFNAEQVRNAPRSARSLEPAVQTSTTSVARNAPRGVSTSEYTQTTTLRENVRAATYQTSSGVQRAQTLQQSAPSSSTVTQVETVSKTKYIIDQPAKKATVQAAPPIIKTSSSASSLSTAPTAAVPSQSFDVPVQQQRRVVSSGVRGQETSQNPNKSAKSIGQRSSRSGSAPPARVPDASFRTERRWSHETTQQEHSPRIQQRKSPRTPTSTQKAMRTSLLSDASFSPTSPSGRRLSGSITPSTRLSELPSVDRVALPEREQNWSDSSVPTTAPMNAMLKEYDEPLNRPADWRHHDELRRVIEREDHLDAREVSRTYEERVEYLERMQRLRRDRLAAAEAAASAREALDAAKELRDLEREAEERARLRREQAAREAEMRERERLARERMLREKDKLAAQRAVAAAMAEMERLQRLKDMKEAVERALREARAARAEATLKATRAAEGERARRIFDYNRRVEEAAADEKAHRVANIAFAKTTLDTELQRAISAREEQIARDAQGEKARRAHDIILVTTYAEAERERRLGELAAADAAALREREQMRSWVTEVVEVERAERLARIARAEEAARIEREENRQLVVDLAEAERARRVYNLLKYPRMRPWNPTGVHKADDLTRREFVRNSGASTLNQRGSTKIRQRDAEKLRKEIQTLQSELNFARDQVARERRAGFDEAARLREELAAAQDAVISQQQRTSPGATRSPRRDSLVGVRVHDKDMVESLRAELEDARYALSTTQKKAAADAATLRAELQKSRRSAEEAERRHSMSPLQAPAASVADETVAALRAELNASKSEEARCVEEAKALRRDLDAMRAVAAEEKRASLNEIARIKAQQELSRSQAVRPQGGSLQAELESTQIALAKAQREVKEKVDESRRDFARELEERNALLAIEKRTASEAVAELESLRGAEASRADLEIQLEERLATLEALEAELATVKREAAIKEADKAVMASDTTSRLRAELEASQREVARLNAEAQSSLLRSVKMPDDDSELASLKAELEDARLSLAQQKELREAESARGEEDLRALSSELSEVREKLSLARAVPNGSNSATKGFLDEASVTSTVNTAARAVNDAERRAAAAERVAKQYQDELESAVSAHEAAAKTWQDQARRHARELELARDNEAVVRNRLDDSRLDRARDDAVTEELIATKLELATARMEIDELRLAASQKNRQQAIASQQSPTPSKRGSRR